LKEGEVIYVAPPEGFEEEDGKVWILNSALYGLVQAPLRYYEQFAAKVKAFGMQPVGFEGCMWKIKKGGKTLWLITYVDDCILIHDSDALCGEFKKHIGEEFEYTEEGPELGWHLGVKYTRDLEKGTITLTQTAYIDELLGKHGMTKCNPTTTPMVAGTRLSRRDCPERPCPEMGAKYRQIVGSLQWLQTMTRPDLGFAVSELSRFLSNPGKTHMDAAMHVLSYLAGTRLLGLKYSRDGGGIEAFVDSDWASCKDTRKSVGGHLFKLAGAAISWKCKRQAVVALSTSEAEFVAASKAAQEAMYLMRMLLELDEMINEGILMHEDNEGCIELADHPTCSDRTKHIDIRVYFLRQAKEDGYVRLISCPTSEMTADFLTKALSGPAHKYHRECAMGMSGTDYYERVITDKEGVRMR
jgi:hypothetical protein